MTTLTIPKIKPRPSLPDISPGRRKCSLPDIKDMPPSRRKSVRMNAANRRKSVASVPQTRGAPSSRVTISESFRDSDYDELAPSPSVTLPLPSSAKSRGPTRMSHPTTPSVKSLKSATNWLPKHEQSKEYLERKERLLKSSKWSEHLRAYFPDTARKRPALSGPSGDEDYDTDLDKDIGLELCADEAIKQSREVGDFPEYKQKCQQMKVVPNSHFMRHTLDDDFVMRYRYLGYGDVNSMSKEILNQPSISTLDLTDNGIRPAGMLCLAEMLLKNNYISDVNFTDNKLGSFGARLMKIVLVNSAYLHTVDLTGNAIEDKGAKYLSDALENNVTLKKLVLAKNGISDRGARFLGKALATNITLDILDLSWNSIRWKGATDLANGLKLNQHLREFSLSGNGIGDEGARVMALMLRRNEFLEEVDVSDNRISADGAVHLMKFVPVNFKLKVIKMGHNPITQKGAEKFLQAVTKSLKTTLEMVDLDGVPMANDFKEVVEKFQKKRDVAVVYTIPPASRLELRDPPYFTMQQVLDLVRPTGVDLRQLFWDLQPEMDFLTAQEVLATVQRTGVKLNEEKLQTFYSIPVVRRDLRRKFLLKDLLLLVIREDQEKEHAALITVAGEVDLTVKKKSKRRHRADKIVVISSDSDADQSNDER